MVTVVVGESPGPAGFGSEVFPQNLRNEERSDGFGGDTTEPGPSTNPRSSRTCLRGQLLEDLVRDIEVGVDVIYVVLVFDCVEQLDQGARVGFLDLDRVLRDHLEAE